MGPTRKLEPRYDFDNTTEPLSRRGHGLRFLRLENRYSRSPPARVEDVSVSVTAGTMTVKHQSDEALAPAIAKRVTGLGYKVIPLPSNNTQVAKAEVDNHACGCGHDHHDHSSHDHDHEGHDHSHGHDHDHDHDHGAHGHDHAGHGHKAAGEAVAGLHGHDHGPTSGPWWKSAKGRLTIASGVAVAAAWAIGKMVPELDAWIFTAAMLVGLIPIARRAFMAALAGTPFSIEMLMTIAAIGAVIIGASEEAAAVVFLFLIGELLEVLPRARLEPVSISDRSGPQDRAC